MMKSSLFFYMIVGLLSACRTVSRQQDGADVKFGHIVGWKDGTILSVPPNEKIHICQDGASVPAVEMIHRALLDWAKAGGMGKGIQAAVACPNDQEAAAIFVQLGGCALKGAWAETLRAGPKRWLIKYCFVDAYTYDFALHEMGHVFGQCDRYGAMYSPPHPARGGNCSFEEGSNDGVFDQPSAMQSGGPAHPGRVTEDDIRGVKSLLKRDDIHGAKVWRNFLSAAGGAGEAATGAGGGEAGEGGCSGIKPSDIQVKAEFGAVVGSEINFQLKLMGSQEILDEVTEVRYDVKEWWSQRVSVSTDRTTNFSSGTYRTWGRGWYTNGTGVKVGDCTISLPGTLISW